MEISETDWGGRGGNKQFEKGRRGGKEVKGKCVCGHRHENLTSHNTVLFELHDKWACN